MQLPLKIPLSEAVLLVEPPLKIHSQGRSKIHFQGRSEAHRKKMRLDVTMHMDIEIT